MSSGFLVVLSVALTFVVAPSMLAIMSAWRCGGAYRLIAAAGLIAIFCLAVLFIVLGDWQDYEARTLLFLAGWGMLLLLATIPFLLFTLGKSIYQLLYRKSP